MPYMSLAEMIKTCIGNITQYPMTREDHQDVRVKIWYRYSTMIAYSNHRSLQGGRFIQLTRETIASTLTTPIEALYPENRDHLRNSYISIYAVPISSTASARSQLSTSKFRTRLSISTIRFCQNFFAFSCRAQVVLNCSNINGGSAVFLPFL